MFENKWAKHAVSEFVLIKPFAPWLKLNLLAASGEERGVWKCWEEQIAGSQKQKGKKRERGKMGGDTDPLG